MKASSSGILSDQSRFIRGIFTPVSEGVAKVYRGWSESDPYLLRVFNGITRELQFDRSSLFIYKESQDFRAKYQVLEILKNILHLQEKNFHWIKFTGDNRKSWINFQ